MILPGSADHLADQRADLLRFAAGSRHDLGFGNLDDVGGVDPASPVELYVTCRMTHVFALGALANEPPAPGGPGRAEMLDLVAHGVRSLLGPLRDAEHGGWSAVVGADGPVDDSKQAYAHSFVVLAGSSALAAGVEGAERLLAEALEVQERRFWDEATGLVVERWDQAWTRADPYRGVNAVMHTVEAYLAATDVTGDERWALRAGRMAARVVGWARANGWRIPEHFDADWSPLLEHNRDRPADKFRPYGATVGHGLEWARLLVAVDATLGQRAPAGLVDAAVALHDRAVADGWAVDGADGFVYTTDWSGRPVVRNRLHWVLAEAVAAASVLERTTGGSRYAAEAAAWWAYADRCLVDHERGSWHHELDPDNVPTSQTWAGKPDAYHAYQAALVPEVPTTPSFATALRRGLRAGAPQRQV
ncbi:AGE family epimerase/isomerase [uncultured Pseudokineococcus sp.]|uniref:AGE family epimerase/isomerase n=1 Tax=uncultured Pseudokineococcus sp. TaxID=1642928 RepID=UPI0026086012|nr:AGE family epimerase/isomerase [uncultured Pseudokineococcus sp.]